MIGKFPSANDDWPVLRWEAVAIELARGAGIHVPAASLQVMQKRPLFIMSRFDRDDAGRRAPFISALAAVGAADGDVRSYIELVDILRQDGPAPERDAAQLWRRMAFNILMSNTDGHLCNHG